MSTPLFSIIIPSFNGAAKLQATLESVLTQEPAAMTECLVIDGGSADSTLALLRGQTPRLRWISEPDAGIYDAMNKGIRLARGRFLYFLGIGDRLRAGVLRAVADLLPTGGRSLEFVYGDVNWPSFQGTYGGVFDHCRLARENISHQAIFYDRGIFDLLGEFDLRYKICADYAMNIRCFAHSAIRKTYLDLVVADFEGGGVSASKDWPFYDEVASLAWRQLGPIAGLTAHYHHSSRFRWARGLNYHLRQPLRTLPGRTLRLVRRSFL